MFLGYASRHGRVLLDRTFHRPKDWARERLRRAEAHIPDEVAFATKPMLGLAVLERARAAGVPFAWITGDSVYGGVYALRQWAQQHRCGSVLAVASNQYLGMRLVSNWISGLGEADWQRLGAGDRAKGPRLYDWAFLPHAGVVKGFRCGLLVRRSLADPSDLDLLSHPRSRDNDAGCLGENRRHALVHREPVRGEQGRGRAGSVRSPLLDGMAPAYHLRHAGPRLSRCRPKGRYRGVWTEKPHRRLAAPDPSEIRHLIVAMIGRPYLDREQLFHWSAWRRRHQQSAGRAHWTRRAWQPPETRLYH